MVDRTARDELADVLERYMAEEANSYELDEELMLRDWPRDDRTLNKAIRVIWLSYDDFVDHKVLGPKANWDQLQRIVLLLRSDDQMEVTGGRRLTLRQVIPLACLALFVGAVAQFGWGWHLLAVSVPLGVVSMLLSWWRLARDQRHDTSEPVASPYESVAELLAARRRVPGFRKRPYPPRIDKRRIRGPASEPVMWICFLVPWLLFSPVALLFQAWPRYQGQCRLVPADESEILRGRPLPDPPPSQLPPPPPPTVREVAWDRLKLSVTALVIFAIILLITFAVDAVLGGD